MITNDKFIKAAALEREKLTSFYNERNIMNPKFTPTDSFHHFDSTFKKDGKLYIVEAKVRTDKMDSKLFSTGYMLEKMKYDNLVKLAEQQKDKNPTILYINFFEDGVITFNLTARMNNTVTLPEVEVMKCNKTTMSNNGKVDKKIYLLEVSKKDKKEYTHKVEEVVVDETQQFVTTEYNAKQVVGTVKKGRGLDATTSWFFGE